MANVFAELGKLIAEGYTRQLRSSSEDCEYLPDKASIPLGYLALPRGG